MQTLMIPPGDRPGGSTPDRAHEDAPPGAASPDSRARLLAAVAARDWVAAEAWCRREKHALIWSWLGRALRALGR
jgi:hypothetical protein